MWPGVRDPTSILLTASVSKPVCHSGVEQAERGSCLLLRVLFQDLADLQASVVQRLHWQYESVNQTIYHAEEVTL